MTGVALACTGTTAGLVALTTGTAVAFSAVESQGYTISGASAVISDLTASVVPDTASTPGNAVTGNYSLRFKTPASLPVGGAGAGSIAVSSAAAPSGVPLSGVTNVGVADLTTGFAFNASGSSLNASATDLVIKLGASSTAGRVNAGDTILLSFTATNPAVGAPTAYTFDIATSASPTPQAAPALTIVPAAAPASASVDTHASGTGAYFSLSGARVPTGTTSNTSFTLQSCTGTAPSSPCTPGSGTSSGTGDVRFPSTPYSYSVTDATTGRALTVASVSPVSTANGATTIGGVTIHVASATPFNVGDSLTVTAVAGTPVSPESVYLVAGFPGGSPAAVAAGPLSFGNSVSSVAVSVSNPNASASATYSVSFTTSGSGALPSGGTIVVQGPKETSFAHVTGALVNATGTQTTQVVPATTGTPGLAASTTNTQDDTLSISTTLPIRADEPLTLTIFGVDNPQPGSYAGAAGLAVSTNGSSNGGDPVPAYNGSAYVISPAVMSTQAPSVTVSPNTAGALASYNISSFRAASNLTAAVDSIAVSAPSGTQLPGTATLVDVTTSTSQHVTAKSGAGTADVIYALASSLNAGDVLSLSLSNVVNPAGTPSGSAYNLYLGADTVAGNTAANGGQGLSQNTVPTVTTTSTTTTVAPRPKPKPAKPEVAALTAQAHMALRNHVVGIRLRCRQAACTGFIRFVHDRTGFGNRRYHLGRNQTAVFGVKLDAAAIRALNRSRSHRVRVTQITSVNRGVTKRRQVVLVR